MTMGAGTAFPPLPTSGHGVEAGPGPGWPSSLTQRLPIQGSQMYEALALPSLHAVRTGKKGVYIL